MTHGVGFSIVLMAVCTALAGCASQPPSTGDRINCGGLPPPFTPPFACPIDKDKARLKVRDHGNGCIDIEHEPDERGGLHLPRQIVCPTFGSQTENKR